jgi:alpha-galactosidase
MNRGCVGARRIVFIGASYKFVHRVVRDLMIVGGFDRCEIVLHDIDEVPLRIVGDLLDRMIAVKHGGMRVIRTLDRKEALRGADAVILSITIGGREADFASFEACAKFGIPVGVGDTLGPAALARNIRTVPFVLELVRDMQELCPLAVLLNFTNPMSVVTGVAARYGGMPVFGLCHSADELYDYFATIFACRKSDIDMEVAGVNHQSFVVALRIGGIDRTKEIPVFAARSKAQVQDSLIGIAHDTRLQQDLCRLLGAWPSTGEEHLAEFYSFFYTPRRLSTMGFKHIKQLQPARQTLGRTPCPPIIEEWAYGAQGPQDLDRLTEEHAHELLWAIFTGEPYTRVVNILNRDCGINDIERDACVEVKATIAGRNVVGTRTTLPPAVHSLVQRWTTIHELSIRAAIDCNREAAHQALLLDPHVTDIYDIESLFSEFLRVLAPHLPTGWKA